MPVFLYVLPTAVVALLVGIGVAYLYFQRRASDGASAVEAKAQLAMAEAETQA